MILKTLYSILSSPLFFLFFSFLLFQIISAMLSMEMINAPEASVLMEMARTSNEYVIAAFELYQSGK